MGRVGRPGQGMFLGKEAGSEGFLGKKKYFTGNIKKTAGLQRVGVGEEVSLRAQGDGADPATFWQ